MLSRLVTRLFLEFCNDKIGPRSSCETLWLQQFWQGWNLCDVCKNDFYHISSLIPKMQTWQNIFHYGQWVINLDKFSHLSVFHLEECPFVVKPAQNFRRGLECTFKSRKLLLQSPRSTSWICSWVLLLSKYRTIFVGNLFSSCHWWVPFCLPDPVEYSDHVSNNLHPSNFEHGSCRISSK